MTDQVDAHAGRAMTRRSLLLGALGLAGVGLLDCSSPRRASKPAPAPSPATSPTTTSAPEPVRCERLDEAGPRIPLWQLSIERGLVYGSSAATWQLADPEYRRLFAREAAILFTEDDLLWYRLRPTPRDELDFSYGDRIVSFAEGQGSTTSSALRPRSEPPRSSSWTDCSAPASPCTRSGCRRISSRSGSRRPSTRRRTERSWPSSRAAG